ncbi:multiple epidermal growth factor-like domains protein 10 [Saccostrea cucullata]|uniref:multiple epidermal growth factor-like domains protein 10 n=1 Tax=Saccostrea cuccullata TaxID=36930 RepID=UPI002ED6220B
MAFKQHFMQHFFIYGIFMTISIYRITFAVEDCNTNYYKVGDVCEDCPPGYFGLKCMLRCPPPLYGKLCGKICDCEPNECNPTYGCPDEDKGVNTCSQGLLVDANQRCCYHYHKVNYTCQACPLGYFGSECSSLCPFPSYGFRCTYLCNCSNSNCNHVTGCLPTIESSLSIKRTTEIINIVPSHTAELNNSNTIKFITLRSANAYHSKTAIIVSIGTGIICMLIFYIIYEIRICRRQYVPEIVQNECDTSENVYADPVEVIVEDDVIQN